MKNILSVNDIQTLCPVAYHFLVNNDLVSLTPGRYDLENGVFANIISYETKQEKDCRFESHENYIDLQFIIQGIEKIAVAPVAELSVSEAYDAAHDITFFASPTRSEMYTLSAGFGLWLAPEDGHEPGICSISPAPVKKAVLKIPVSQ